METDLIKKRIADILQNALNSGDYKNKTELSEKLNTTITSLTKYLNGTTFPQSDWLYYLCKELKIAPNWIIFGDEEEKKLPEEESKEKMMSQLIEAQKKIIKYQEQEIENLKKQLVSKNNNYSYAAEPNPELKKK